MEESITYQEIKGLGKAEGLLEEARRMIVIVGGLRLGRPSRKVLRVLEGIDDREHLETLARSLDGVDSWDDLLGTARG